MSFSQQRQEARVYAPSIPRKRKRIQRIYYTFYRTEKGSIKHTLCNDVSNHGICGSAPFSSFVRRWHARASLIHVGIGLDAVVARQVHLQLPRELAEGHRAAPVAPIWQRRRVLFKSFKLVGVSYLQEQDRAYPFQSPRARAKSQCTCQHSTAWSSSP